MGLLLAVIDLGRAGYVQHRLDSGAADLAQSLAGISGTTTSGSPYVYTPTPLDPTSTTTFTVYQGISMTVPQAMQKALGHARTVAGGAFSEDQLLPPAGSFVPNGTTTISNTQVTVVGARASRPRPRSP